MGEIPCATHDPIRRWMTGELPLFKELPLLMGSSLPIGANLGKNYWATQVPRDANDFLTLAAQQQNH